MSADLTRIVDGVVSADNGTRAECSIDYGGIVRRTPAVVVTPADAQDVVRVIRYARARHIAVSARGAAHSQAGQCLSEGIVLNMRSLGGVEAIDERTGSFVAGGGTWWRAATNAALSRGLVPPVLTSNLQTTLSGTHSVGGVGQTSFRFGTQADNCLALEIVTGAGDLVRCSPQAHGELFAHVLCGVGQLAIITRVTHRLRPRPAEATTTVFVYRNRAAALADLKTVVDEQAADAIVMSAVFFNGHPLYRLMLTVEEPAIRSSTRGVTAACRGRLAGTTTRDFADCINVDLAAVYGAATTDAHVGVDLIVPLSRAEKYCRTIIDGLPPALHGSAQVAALVLDRRRLARPLFVTPADQHLLLLTLQVTVAPAQARTAADALHELIDRSVALGATRYLPGWVRLDAVGWQRHFAAHWPTLARLKAEHDPAAILARGVMTCDADADRSLPARVPDERHIYE